MIVVTLREFEKVRWSKEFEQRKVKESIPSSNSEMVGSGWWIIAEGMNEWINEKEREKIHVERDEKILEEEDNCREREYESDNMLLTSNNAWWWIGCCSVFELPWKIISLLIMSLSHCVCRNYRFFSILFREERYYSSSCCSKMVGLTQVWEII